MTNEVLRPHYLDASAIVKLLCDEDGSPRLRTYFKGRAGFYTTTICFAEAFGAIKQKWLRCQLIQPQYRRACNTDQRGHPNKNQRFGKIGPVNR